MSGCRVLGSRNVVRGTAVGTAAVRLVTRSGRLKKNTFWRSAVGSGTTDGCVFGISVALEDAAIAENYAAETSIALKGWAQIEKGWAEDCLLCRYEADNLR